MGRTGTRLPSFCLNRVATRVRVRSPPIESKPLSPKASKLSSEPLSKADGNGRVRGGGKEEVDHERRIIIVVDSSPEAKVALQWAFSHSIQSNDTVVLVQIVKPPKRGKGDRTQRERYPKGLELLLSMKSICQAKKPENSLQEMWALLNFLLPSIFNSVQNFEEWFNAPFVDKCEVSLTDEEELLIIRRLHQVIRPFLLRGKKDEVEKYIPQKTQVILKCDLSAWQKAYYQQVTGRGRVGLESGIKSKSLQNLSMQLRKCCNHPYLFVGDYNMWQKEQIVRASGKFELLDRLLPKLQRAGHRVLLFSQMTRLIDILEIYLQLYEFKYLRLDGSTKTEDRGTLLKQFNAPDSPYFMFLLSTRAGGLGLNLQTADTVIIFDSDWNPQMDQQAEDRAHRIGQKKEVRVFVLVSVGSIEEEILERAKQKMGIDAKVIQAGLFNTTSTAQDRRQMLQEIMQRGTSSLGTDVPSEREINRLAARSEEEFWLFEKMDEERRQKERYRSRLMEENEVPEWVFYKSNEDKISMNQGLGTQGNEVTGKRSRKEVVYTDLLTEVQWMKVVESGEDMSKITSRRKRKEHSSDACESGSNGGDQQSLSEQRNANRFILDEEASDDSPIMYKSSLPHNKDEGESDASSWPDNITWRTHKRKRSNHNLSSGHRF